MERAGFHDVPLQSFQRSVAPPAMRSSRTRNDLLAKPVRQSPKIGLPGEARHQAKIAQGVQPVLDSVSRLFVRLVL